MTTKTNKLLTVALLFAVAVNLILSSYKIQSANATTLLNYGFEEGLTGWTIYNTPTVIYGESTYSGRAYLKTDDNEYAEYNVGWQNKIFYQTKIRLFNYPTLLESNMIALVGIAETAPLAEIGIRRALDSETKWFVRWQENGAYQALTMSNLQKNPSKYGWITIKMEVDLSTTDGTTDGEYKFWVNGEELTDLTKTNVDTDYVALNVIRCQNYPSSGIIRIDYDSVIVDTVGITTGAEAFYEDFNDNSLDTNIWTKWNFSIVSGSITEINKMLKVTINAGAVSWRPLEVYTEIDYMAKGTFDISIDKFIPTENGIGYLAIGNTSTWGENTYEFYFSKYYGGENEVYYYRTGTGDIHASINRLYSSNSKPNFQQLRISLDSTTNNVSFYRDDVKFYSNTNGWLFGNWSGQKLHISLGTYSISTDTTSILYDNLFVDVNGTRRVYSVGMNPTDAILYADILPQPKLAVTQSTKMLKYDDGLSLSFYVTVNTGYQFNKWTKTNTTTTDYTQANITLSVYQQFNMTINIALMANYRLLTLVAGSYGLHLNPDYGNHAYIVNTLVEVTATPFLINPPLVYPTFNRWKLDNDLLQERSNVYAVSMSANHTLTVYANIPTPNDTWNIRQVSILPNSPPAGVYYGNTSMYHSLINDLVKYIPLINTVGTRISWAWNLTADEYGTIPYQRVTTDGYCPSPNNTRDAIRLIKQHGLNASLLVNYAPDVWDILPIGWSWDNTNIALTWLNNYNSTILFPLAQLAQEENVTAFGLSTELGDPNYNLEWFTNATINAKWSSIITSLRTVYSGKIYAQIQGWSYRWSVLNKTLGHLGFNVLSNTTYLSNLDYIQLAYWAGDLISSEPFTAFQIADGWYNKVAEHNWIQDVQDFYEIMGKKITLNTGYTNAYGNIFHPWDNNGDFRKDDVQYLAWQGTMWAFQPQEFFEGMDFERYNQWYYSDKGICGDSNYSDIYFSQSIRLLYTTQAVINNTLFLIIHNATGYPTPEDYETFVNQSWTLLYMGVAGIIMFIANPVICIKFFRHQKLKGMFIFVVLLVISIGLMASLLYGVV